MRQMRARAFALRDVFPDVLRGLPVAEEIMDAPTERFMGAAEEVKPAAPAALPAYAMADFEKNFPAWQKLVSAGKKTAGDLLATLSTKATFTEHQKAAILCLKPAPSPAPAPAEEAPASATDAWVEDMEAAEQGSAQ